MTIYSDYTRDRIGWFFGLRAWQLAAVSVSTLPVFWAIQRQAWLSMLLFSLVWAVVVLVTAVQVKGRPMLGWLWALVCFTVGAATGARRFTARAAQGRATNPEQVDLPGVLAGVEIHDGPPTGAAARRVALVQNHAAHTWAVTCAVTHPGIGMSDVDERSRQAAGLSSLVDATARAELADELIVQVRTVPDDGAERSIWVEQHRRPATQGLSRQVNDDLHRSLSRASVRTEAFVTIVVPETRLARAARHSGGGLAGRARVLGSVMAEVEAALRGGLSMTQVSWLTSPELALACRSGFAPGDRAGIVQALAEHQHDPGVEAGVPWAMAGPSGAEATVRHYSHDAWNSISATVMLPANGAALGALAPVLTPDEAGERRSYMVCFPILTQQRAERHSDSAEFAADMGGELRRRAGVKAKARHRNDAAKAHGVDEKLARGAALMRPYAVCTVTAPKTVAIADYGRRLDASIRRSGFAPLRLDLAQDAGFLASTIPLGLGLTRTVN